MSALVLASLLLLGGQNQADLQSAVRKARTVAITPRPEPPAWMDDAKVQAGYTLVAKHGKTVLQILRTSSLAGTFGGKDIAPVVMQTGRLPHEFTQRMRETEREMFALYIKPKDRDAFLKRGYAKAVALGQMHVAVGQAVQSSLNWNPRVRVPMNGQAYALVLYSFAWWPVEAMIARKEIDPVTDRPELDAWFHLWSVYGYAMGTPEALLPKDYETASKMIVLLKKAQYPAPGEPLVKGLPELLGGNVRMAAADSKTSLQQAAKDYADLLALSPGVVESLGLGTDPTKRLAEYAALPVPK